MSMLENECPKTNSKKHREVRSLEKSETTGEIIISAVCKMCGEYTDYAYDSYVDESLIQEELEMIFKKIKVSR